ncbi:MAG: hypothetical protein O2798_04845 [Chloroflexi bacterium]|nr:hypothetical protein [Chloroflexota bacterium]MDA1240154.1 hypothetical protein [Chloroflexota bacterium]
MQGLTREQSRQLGQLLMALSALQALVYFIGALRRSYLVLAIPAGIVSGALAGIGVWVGYTMATGNFDNPADWPPDIERAEGAPPPDALG